MPILLLRTFASFGLAAMTTAILAGFAVGSFTQEGGVLLDLAWGRVTLIDIYLAFGLGWVWIAWREASVRRALAWLAATLVTGSLALFAYLYVASMRAETVTEVVVGPRRTLPPAPLRTSAPVGADH